MGLVFADYDFFSMVVIPLLIFFSRVLDVSIGTLRIIFVARGLRLIAACLGFFEVLIWLIAITQVMQNLTGWPTYLAYGLGFATGNYVGVTLESRIALGTLIVRIISRDDGKELTTRLWNAGFGVTTVDAWGGTGPVKVIFTVVKRKHLNRVIDLIKVLQPNAFYTVEDLRFAHETGGLPVPRRSFSWRKGK